MGRKLFDESEKFYWNKDYERFALLLSDKKANLSIGSLRSIFGVDTLNRIVSHYLENRWLYPIVVMDLGEILDLV